MKYPLLKGWSVFLQYDPRATESMILTSHDKNMLKATPSDVHHIHSTDRKNLSRGLRVMDHDEKQFLKMLHIIYKSILSRWISNLSYVLYDDPRNMPKEKMREPDFADRHHLLAVHGLHIVFTTGCKRFYPIERSIIDWSVSKAAEYARHGVYDYSTLLSRIPVEPAAQATEYGHRAPVVPFAIREGRGPAVFPEGMQHYG